MKTIHHPPSTIHYDVLGIGNAIVDVLASAEDAFLAVQSLTKGAMTLIDEARAEALYRQMGPATECSGGSAANTLAGLASLGGRAAFIGKVKDDQLGGIFRHDMRSIGVHFDTHPAKAGPATARCLIFVTQDAQRTMNTYLGACTNVSETDIDEALIASSLITYVEGYLWDEPHAKKAIRKALAAAHAHGRKVAFTLSDAFCVDRHRAEFLELIKNDIDILFANENEITSFFQIDDVMEAARRIQGMCEVVAVTRSEKGSLIVTADSIEAIEASEVPHVIDTTGAGDLYAAGFLYGITQGWSLRASAELAGKCAAEIIQQLGARTVRPLRRLVA